MKIRKIELVLTHLIKNRAIDQRISGIEYGCWRLSSIIFDLRRSGLKIETKKTKGDPCSYYLKSHKAATDLAQTYTNQRIEYNKRNHR